MKPTSTLLLIEKAVELKSISLFSETPESVVAEIAHLIHEMEIPSGTEVFHEGETGTCMYVIYKGKIKIHRGGQELAVLGEKDFFGELSMLDTEMRSASATAINDCLLFRIDQNSFYDLMETRPEVVKGIIKVLCKRLREMNEKITLLKREATSA